MTAGKLFGSVLGRDLKQMCLILHKTHGASHWNERSREILGRRRPPPTTVVPVYPIIWPLVAFEAVETLELQLHNPTQFRWRCTAKSLTRAMNVFSWIHFLGTSLTIYGRVLGTFTFYHNQLLRGNIRLPLQSTTTSAICKIFLRLSWCPCFMTVVQ